MLAEILSVGILVILQQQLLQLETKIEYSALEPLTNVIPTESLTTAHSVRVSRAANSPMTTKSK